MLADRSMKQSSRALEGKDQPEIRKLALRPPSLTVVCGMAFILCPSNHADSMHNLFIAFFLKRVDRN
ncbi:hypothetical protein BN2476_490057 [Paraburkholderia piptadeniae]|uniref:Uncharacterized protein n=1 Tax=Paraburkholderia piptadeniae TaxID=1701573 RepID=A0A1N7SEV0_9BURK|nr:hypothetical protein BN2476_490057 [Paraburkholderia piptadeniae]